MTRVKQEKELELARRAIKDLNSQMGTVILDGESESDDTVSMDEGEKVEAEVPQKDSFFAHEYTFKTNVRKLKLSRSFP